jgi:hypothetical protein
LGSTGQFIATNVCHESTSKSCCRLSSVGGGAFGDRDVEREVRTERGQKLRAGAGVVADADGRAGSGVAVVREALEQATWTTSAPSPAAAHAEYESEA